MAMAVAMATATTTTTTTTATALGGRGWAEERVRVGDAVFQKYGGKDRPRAAWGRRPVVALKECKAWTMFLLPGAMRRCPFCCPDSIFFIPFKVERPPQCQEPKPGSSRRGPAVGAVLAQAVARER